RQRVGPLEGAVAEPDAVEVGQRLPAERLRVAEDAVPGAVQPTERARQYVLEAGQAAHEVELLEHEADVAPQCTQLAAAGADDVGPEDLDRAGVRSVQSVEVA